MTLLGETRWYYVKSSRKVYIFTGYEYLKYIKVDLGEMAYFKLDSGLTIKAERV